MPHAPSPLVGATAAHTQSLYINGFFFCFLFFVFVRADCIHILGQCIDKTRLAKGITAEGLCTILSPIDDNAPCVSLDKFLGKTKTILK